MSLPLTDWGKMWYDTPKEIPLTPSMAPTGLNGLAEGNDVKAMQDAVNKNADAMVKDATVWDITLKDLLVDAQEALIGVTSDLLGQSDRKSVRDILGHGNRLRGIGVVLIILAVAGSLIDWMMGGSGTTVLVDGE